MPVTVTFTVGVDDSGLGQDGTALDVAYVNGLITAIDTALALLLPLAGGTVSGATTFSATVTHTGKTDHTGELSINDTGQAMSLASGNNNNQTLNAGVTTLTVTSASGGSTLTGLTGGYAGRVIIIMNIGAGEVLTIPVESASSTDVNRFGAGGNLAGGECATYKYNIRWRRIG